MAVAHLTGTPVSAAVARDDAETIGEEVEHLSIPIVGTKRPTMMEEDRLRIPRTPVLIEDLDSIFRGNGRHVGALLKRNCVLSMTGGMQCLAFGPLDPVVRLSRWHFPVH